MTTPLLTPTGEISSLGFGKETTFGVAVSPTLFHAYDSFNAQPKTIFQTRSATRKRLGQTYPATGAFGGDGSMDLEATPDTLAQVLAWSFGGQTTPTHNIVSTTLGVAIAATGVSFATPASMQNIFVGSQLTIDTAGNQETVTVTAVTATTFQANFTKTHLVNVAIVATSATAYTSKLSMGTPLPTFTAERAIYNVGTIGNTFARDYVGCKMDSLSLSLDSKGGLKPKFSFAYASEFIQGSPATPSFSTKNVYTFENPNVLVIYKGVAIGITGKANVTTWDVTLANNLLKGYYSPGSRIVYGFPEQQRKASGKITLGFEEDSQYQDFLGGSTGPGVTINGVSLALIFATIDLADGTLGFPYALSINLPNLALTQYSDPGKASGALEQTFTYEAAESAPAAGDDITAQIITTASAIY